MHFQVINDIYYVGILEKIKHNIPEFTSLFDEEDGIYPILGELGTFIIENIDNQNIFDDCIHFINDAIENGGNETEDVIVLQIFQKMYETSFIASKIRECFSEKVKVIFDRYQAEYNRIS